MRVIYNFNNNDFSWHWFVRCENIFDIYKDLFELNWRTRYKDQVTLPFKRTMFGAC